MISFWKNNLSASVEIYEDGNYKIHSLKKSKSKQGIYDECVKEIYLLGNAKEEEVGQAIIEVFRASEEYHQGKKAIKNKRVCDRMQVINTFSYQCNSKNRQKVHDFKILLFF